MLIFCEECGERLSILSDQEKAQLRRVKCQGCGETLTVCEEMHTAELHCPAISSHTDDVRRIREIKSPKRQKVLIVDDSRLIRRAIRRIFEDSKSLEVVGEAVHGQEALELIPSLNPDVVTLDINMPVMDGLTTLKHMMIKSPKPTVMISTLTQEGASITFDALKYGAVDFIPKPSQLDGEELEKQHERIVQKVTLASRVETGAIQFLRSAQKAENNDKVSNVTARRVFAIGASEGGYSSLLKIIPLIHPGIAAAFLVVLYAEPMHVDAFANYLNEHSMLPVKRAANGETLRGATCYLASGDEYMTLERMGGRLVLQVSPNPFPNRRGAINMLMMSVAEIAGARSVGMILSGSGKDGMEGIKEITRQGGAGIVQNPRTCLCKEMPINVLTNVKVRKVIADRDIAAEINKVYT